MKIELKSFWSDTLDVDLSEYEPEDRSIVGLYVELRIGRVGHPGADDFRLFVCTPKWLWRHVWTPLWGRHMLVMNSYDCETMVAEIEARIEACAAPTWEEASLRLARFFAWEFEDYVDDVPRSVLPDESRG